MGNCPNLAVYTIAYTCLIGSIMSAGYVAGGALVAQWFPKRKGVVMGYTTMGLNIASATWVPMMTLIIAKMGFEKGVIIPGVLVAVLAIIGLVFMRDTPQERGVNPDMVSDEVYKAEYDTDNAEDDKRWTVGKTVKNSGGMDCCHRNRYSAVLLHWCYESAGCKKSGAWYVSNTGNLHDDSYRCSGNLRFLVHRYSG